MYTVYLSLKDPNYNNTADSWNIILGALFGRQKTGCTFDELQKDLGRGGSGVSVPFETVDKADKFINRIKDLDRENRFIIKPVFPAKCERFSEMQEFLSGINGGAAEVSE